MGKIVRVDDTTGASTRGKFERVCVELDLTKTLKMAMGQEG